MSASFNGLARRESARAALAGIGLRYALAALCCGIFAFVYEQFSHGVWSAAMVFAFAFPLAGALPFLAMAAARRCPPRRAASEALWHAGVATLTVGSLFSGALEIYGTTNRLTIVYVLAGALLVASAAALWLAGAARNKKSPEAA